MAVDDSGQGNSKGGEPPQGGGQNPDDKEDRSTKMNAAKAFYRAMYAGEDVAPDDFGLVDKQRAAAQPEGQTNQGPCQNCARLESQVTHANELKEEAERHYKRMAADFENYKRRVDREREEFQGIGVQKAIESILPALDDMDRAKMSLANVSDPKAIVDSLNLVLTRFYKCMEGVGIKQLEAIGQPFDPRNHEPVQEVETNEFPDGVVMHELRKGYIFKDKVLRPSLVNVSSNASGVVVPKAPPPPPPPVVEENSKPEEVAAPPIPLPASEVAHTQANSTAADSQTSAAPSNGSDQAAVVAPESEDKPAVAVDAQPHDKVRSENVLEAAAREAKKTNETGDLLKKFTGTATGELPIFQMDEDSLTMPVQDLNLSTPELQLEPKKKKLDESLFDLSDKKENE